MSMSMSKTFIGGAVCREFESEAPTRDKKVDKDAMNFIHTSDNKHGDGHNIFTIFQNRDFVSMNIIVYNKNFTEST